jgi:hypothetical protein
MTREQKANLVYELVKDIVEDATSDSDDTISGLMRTFGEEYILRMETFASLFKTSLNK